MQVFDPLEKEFPRNNAITAPEVRVVDSMGENLGVMDTRDAIARAEAEEMDLVMIAPQAKPPVCKIITWESFRYQHKKKEKEIKKHQKTIQIKEIKISPKIAGGFRVRGPPHSDDGRGLRVGGLTAPDIF